MGARWRFEQDEEQQWHWIHAEDEAESAHSFPSAAECMLDAVRFAVQRRRAQFDEGREDSLQ